MEELLKLLNDFEERNNISVHMELCSDGSGTLREFWHEELLINFPVADDLIGYLINTSYELNEAGECISPVKIKSATELKQTENG